MPGPYLYPKKIFDFSSLNLLTPFTTVQDSSNVACAANVYTTLIAITLASSKWVQMFVSVAAPGDVVVLATGAVGHEVDFQDFTIILQNGIQLMNLPLSIPAGVRVSLKPTGNVTAEFHMYY